MSLEEIVAVISHDYDRSFDYAFKEKITLEVINKRALLIKRDLDKGRTVDNSIVNTLSNIQMVSTSDPKGWSKTKCPIPKPIRLSEGNTLFSVGSSLTCPYDLVEPERLPYLQYDKYSNSCKRDRFFYRNGHLYSNSAKPLTIQLVAGDPRQFSEFIEGCGEQVSCDFQPDAFITMDMVDPIKRLISETMPNVRPRDFEITPEDGQS